MESTVGISVAETSTPGVGVWMGPLRRSAALPYAILILIALGFSAPSWTARPSWVTDSLFYEAQSREVAGTPAAKARTEVFSGPLGRGIFGPTLTRTDRQWVSESASFYRRRWVVPALGASLRPAFGDRALQLVSLLAYLLSGIAAYLLVLRRYPRRVAFTAAAAVLWFPPFREWAAHPLTDAPGVAAIAATLAAGVWAMTGSWKRVVCWSAAVLALSFTRDAAVIALIAATLYAVSERTRRAAVLAATGLLAAAPAPLLFPTPVRETLAFTFSGNRVPADTSWHFVASEYLPHVRWMIRTEFPFASHAVATGVLLALIATAFWRPSARTEALRTVMLAVLGMMTLALAAVIPALHLPAFPDPLPSEMLLASAVAPLFVPGGDSLVRFCRFGALGAVVMLLLLPEFTHGRLTLVLLPFAAIGLARLLEAANQISDPQPRMLRPRS
jgi:hypothetical protein